MFLCWVGFWYGTEVTSPIRCTNKAWGVHRPHELCSPFEATDAGFEPHPTWKQQTTSRIQPELHSSSHVFVRNDAVRKPLQPPYRGPFAVIRRNDKFFTIDINGKLENVSLDRIKPAFLEDHQNDTEHSSSTATITPPSPPKDHPEIRRTRSGRHVRWPARYVDYFDIGWRDSLLHFGSSSLSIHLHVLCLFVFILWSAFFLHDMFIYSCTYKQAVIFHRLLLHFIRNPLGRGIDV